MNLIRQQLQYMTTKVRNDLERVLDPDKVKYETDKAVFSLVTSDLQDAVNKVNSQTLYGGYPSGEVFLIALAQVDSKYEVFKMAADDIIQSRQMSMPKRTEPFGVVDFTIEGSDDT